MKQIFRYIRPFTGKIAVGLLIKTTGTLMDLALPWMLAAMLDTVAPSGNKGSILFLGLMMVLAACIGISGNVIANRIASAVARDTTRTLRSDLFAKCMSLSCSQVEHFGIPSLETRLTGDTYNIPPTVGMMQRMGVRDVIICDRTGAIYEGREGLNPEKAEIATWTNREGVKGTLAEAVAGADVFVGVSAPGVLTADMVRTMAADPIIFACANPVPEIMPDEALAAGAAVAATGRSDFPNQINNVLAFPGIFRGALDVHASDINDEMMEAAAYAIAGLVDDEKRCAEYIIPGAFDERVAPAVAAAVAEAARRSGVARA